MIRHQRTRLPGFRTPENTVYIGRPSVWGNPFRDIKWDVFFYVNYRRSNFSDWIYYGTIKETGGAIKLFKDMLYNPNSHKVEEPIKNHFNFIRRNIHKLNGKDIMCWCGVDKPCHGDVYLSIFNDDKEKQKYLNPITIDECFFPPMERIINAFPKDQVLKILLSRKIYDIVFNLPDKKIFLPINGYWAQKFMPPEHNRMSRDEIIKNCLKPGVVRKDYHKLAVVRSGWGYEYPSFIADVIRVSLEYGVRGYGVDKKQFYFVVYLGNIVWKNR